MNRASYVTVIAFLFASTPAIKQVHSDAGNNRPSIVILLADDLGSRGLGRYGGPVKTPVLDGLATKGVRFTDFHATSYSPC